MKKIYYIIIGMGMVIASIFIINTFYLYSPFNFPKGNLSKWEYSWLDFKNPIDIEVLSWSEEGDRTIYIPQQNNKEESKYILNSFANIKELEDYSNKEYFDSLPKNRGKEYTVLVRGSNIKSEDGMPIGNILLPFSFHENGNIAQIDGAYFFEITEELKSHIINSYSEELVLEN